MSELTLLALRLLFLVMLWAFVFGIIYALRSDLFGQRARKNPRAATDTPAGVLPPTVVPTPRPTNRGAGDAPQIGAGLEQAPTRVVVTSGPMTGREIRLGREPLTIGRSSESTLAIHDDYTSTHHARLLLWNGGWVIQDLDSTNGTFLAGRRVSVPTHVPVHTPVKIGQTTFELRG